MATNELPATDPQTRLHERETTPVEAVDTSNRDVITAIYAVADESIPNALIQETNGSKAYINHAGLIRLVYDGERDEAKSNPYGLPVNPAADKLSELATSGKISHALIQESIRGFRLADDPLYKAIENAWGNVYSFTDTASGEVICYSVKVDAHSGAETVLVSPEHIDLSRPDVKEDIGAVAIAESTTVL